MDFPELVVVYSHSAGQNVRLSRLPKNGETMRALTWDLDRDGAKGTNVAVAAGRLGIRTALVSRTGDDVWADAADLLLEGCDIDRRYLVRDPLAKTPTGVVFVDEQGNNSIILSPDEQIIPKEQIVEALTAMRGARYCVSGYELHEETADFALRTAKKLGMKTVLNPSPVPKAEADFSFVDLLIVNEPEALELLERKAAACAGAEPDGMAKRLQAEYGCPMVVITLGKDGYAGVDRNTAFAGKAVPAKVVDTSGAGDGFLAAVVSGLIRGLRLQDACAWANHYAAFAVEASGTIPGYLSLSDAERRMAGGK